MTEEKHIDVDGDALAAHGGVTCYTCYFYETTQDQETGLCRRTPPSPKGTWNPNHDDTPIAWWPLVADGDWCSEHMTADAAERQDSPRLLNLTWRTNARDGADHREWTAPCGCAFHPEPSPHVHECSRHIDVPKAWVPGLKVAPRQEGNYVIPGHVEFVDKLRGVGVRWDDHADRGWGQDELDWYSLEGAHQFLREVKP